jgi:hypothetical protein
VTGEYCTGRRKTCPSATLFTTNPTCNDLEVDPGLQGERPATDRLSHVVSRQLSEQQMLFVNNPVLKQRVTSCECATGTSGPKFLFLRPRTGTHSDTIL